VTCTAGISRLLCGDVAWWEATLICGGAMLLGALLMYAYLRATGQWHGWKR